MFSEFCPEGAIKRAGTLSITAHVRLACVVAAVTLITAGCASSLSQARQSVNNDTAHYESPRSLLSSPIGPVSVTVTSETAPELPVKPGNEWLALLLGGTALAPLGLVAPPLYAGALVVGGGMIATESAVGYGTERMKFNTVAQAVRQSDLPAALRETLRTRALPSDGFYYPEARATVAIRGWGVVSESRGAKDRHCFVAAAELSIIRDGKQVLNDPLQLTLVNRSTDAPPVQCAALWKFAEHDGRLVRETTRDYAEVLAVMVTERLGRLQ